ncbi:(2Fe-2S)-binding protein [Shewanella sedimentimangrovi]|uniref:(2Fe-2S)-binding protein n=1 Tax=Shewanella sedimentimangrovi TaxID=2814293 RepID=A0ABX7R1Z6_9GAMM|nr:(2Fe-2S)-binding protein [Shewanella sedimentimangrovi]QSX37095.1 (2Fe-2S)-binding protein [Shewanella sedimentimangrovi]
MSQLRINGRLYTLDADPRMPLLWALRDILGLTGTKYGCGAGLCGACTVHVDGKPARACLTSVQSLEGKSVTTIEGLQDDKLKDSWRRHKVPQCGYCQTGQLMSASALLSQNPNPSDAEIDSAMSGNLCRCGTYTRIRDAIRDHARETNK